MIIILGSSGAGKDTACEILQIPNIKFSRIMKRTFEEWYGCPVGSFDDRYFRETHKLRCGKTPLEVMVDAYHAWDLIDSSLTAYPTMRLCIPYLEYFREIAFTDVRKLSEAELIAEYSHKFSSPVKVVHLTTTNENPLSSDKHLELIKEFLLRESYKPTLKRIHNNKDAQFFEDVKQLLTNGKFVNPRGENPNSF